jgi:hypothetical protein
VDADVDARERDEQREGDECRNGLSRQDGERDDACGGGRRVAGRERGADGRAEERVGLVEPLERPRSPDHGLRDRRQDVARPDAGGGHRRRDEQRSLRPHGEQGCKRDPDEPRVPDDRRRDEDGVEPAGPVLDDPEERVAVELRQRERAPL